jgi:hypothetical protein
MTEILVTGATGRLGGQVVEFLLRRVAATNIVALARDPAELQPLAKRASIPARHRPELVGGSIRLGALPAAEHKLPRLTVDSQPGHGTRFDIYLPIAKNLGSFADGYKFCRQPASHYPTSPFNGVVPNVA